MKKIDKKDIIELKGKLYLGTHITVNEYGELKYNDVLSTTTALTNINEVNVIATFDKKSRKLLNLKYIR